MKLREYLKYMALGAVCAVTSLAAIGNAQAQQQNLPIPYQKDVVGVHDLFDVHDLNDEIRRCAAIVGRIPRLICYDGLSTKLGFIPPEEADREEVILATYGFWEATKKKNHAGEDVLYLKNDSVEDINTRDGLKRKSTLVVQCKNGVTDFYLDWKTPLVPITNTGQNKMVISYQLDRTPRQAVQWELSADRKALFVPNAVEFLRNLQVHKRFIILLVPHNDAQQIVVHDIDGLQDALALVVRECYNLE